MSARGDEGVRIQHQYTCLFFLNEFGFSFISTSSVRAAVSKNAERERFCQCVCLFCSSRVYTPPDPPGYFDGHVWPMYLKNRQEMESMESDICECPVGYATWKACDAGDEINRIVRAVTVFTWLRPRKQCYILKLLSLLIRRKWQIYLFFISVSGWTEAKRRTSGSCV